MSSLSPSPDGHAWLSELQALLLDTDTLHGFLDRLAQLTTQALPEGSSCGVTVRQHSRPITLAASDEWTMRIDQMQYDFDEGPCVDAMSTGKVNYISDTTTEVRWTRFCQRAQDQGVHSCLALPLTSPTSLIGCYNFYSTERDGFAEESRGQLEEYAGNAAGAVAVALKLADQAQLSDNLHQALTSRAVIDRAIGILMAQQRCDADAAFDLLRRASQNRNVKLRELAAEIVTAVSGKPPEPGAFQPPQPASD
ncbi:MAG: GAF and ANTAR domain-containing protein [Actinomycetota bacterium]|nr:GAF and ANTAR domain-containing protein [Actinomycetota bacterium]